MDRYRQIFDHMQEGVAVHELVHNADGDPVDYRITDVNPRFEQILNIPRDSVVGRLATAIYDTMDPPYLETYVRVAAGAPELFTTYFEPMRRHFSISAFPLDEPGSFATVFADITPQVRDAERLAHVNAVLEGVWRINQLITHERNPDILIQQACDALVAIRGFRWAWIARCSRQDTLLSLAGTGIVPAAMDRLRQRLQKGPPPCIDAARQQHRTLFPQSPRQSADCALIDQHPAGHCVAILLADEEHRFGFGCLALDQSAMDDQEIDLLQEAVGDITFALAALDSRQRLRESQRTLTTLVSNLPGMAYRCRNQPDWPMEFASQGCLRITGLSAEELTAGRVAFGKLIHPDDRDSVWRDVQQAIEQRRPFKMEYRLRGIDGVERWVTEQGVAVEPGPPAVLEGYIGDITELVQTAEALRTSERAARSLYEKLPVATLVWRAHEAGPDVAPRDQPNVVLVDYNEAADALTGGAVTGWVGRPASAIPQLDGLPLDLERCLIDHQVIRREMDFRSPDGSRRLVLIVGYVPPDGLTTHLEDITDQRGLEEQLRQVQRLEHEGPVDLLLTDVVMPRMSGRELATRLHQLRPAMKVLYMSGYTDDAIIHHGARDNAMQLLPKPFSAASLTARVRRALDP